MLHPSLCERQGRGARHARGKGASRALVALAAATLLLGAPVLRAQDDAEAREAAAFAQSGRHLEAAARYEDAAKRGFLSWDARLALLAAREYRAAGEPAEAERLLGKARPRVKSDEERALLALVEAGLAFDAGDASRALARLREAPFTVSNELAADLLALRARAEFATGAHLAGLRSFEGRSALLPDDAARAANSRELFDQLLLYPPETIPTQPGMTERERGWLELPAVVAAQGDATSDPAQAARAATLLRDWRTRHPGHPGAAFLPQDARMSVAVAAGPDAPIALLLPLSGKAQAAARAVRDGFAAAWFASADGDVRPRIAVYDTAEAGAAAAYARAVADRARIVVGPLLKEDLQALLAANPAGLPLPTLALNSSADGALPPAFLYQYSLDPEQEARAVARRIAADGHVRGIALYPEGAWGRRVQAAFEDELTRRGTVLLMTPGQFYSPDARDYSPALRAALGRYGGAGDRRDGVTAAASRNAEAERLAGPQFAFVAASPQAARAIRPQLRFQMTYDLPVYSTSDAWDAGVRAVADLEGLTYPEMPWLLYGGQGAPDLWQALQEEWQSRARGRWRLYAFGFDAYRLAQQLGSGVGVAGVQGLTGTLEVSPGDGVVRRSVPFARVEAGRPAPAVSGAVAPPP